MRNLLFAAVTVVVANALNTKTMAMLVVLAMLLAALRRAPSLLCGLRYQRSPFDGFDDLAGHHISLPASKRRMAGDQHIWGRGGYSGLHLPPKKKGPSHSVSANGRARAKVQGSP
jgi:hypothetical protein